MAGLLNNFGVDLDTVETPTYNNDNPPDDIYEFVVSEFFLKEGTKNDENAKYLILEYKLGDAGHTKAELWKVPDGPADEKGQQAMGYYKQRLKTLGIEDSDMNNVGPDDIVGLTGTLELKTKRARNGNDYQNVYNVKVAEAAAPPAQQTQQAATTRARSAGVRANPFG